MKRLLLSLLVIYCHLVSVAQTICNADGTVTDAVVEDFDTSVYDEEAFETYVKDAVAALQTEYGEDSVKLDSFSVDNGKANIYMTFASADYLAVFDKVTCFNGTVALAMASDYDFDGNFVTVNGGVASTTDASGNADGTDATSNTNYKVLICEEPAVYEVPGTIVMISSQYVTMLSESSVRVDSEEEHAVVYIIYEQSAETK